MGKFGVVTGECGRKIDGREKGRLNSTEDI